MTSLSLDLDGCALVFRALQVSDGDFATLLPLRRLATEIAAGEQAADVLTLLALIAADTALAGIRRSEFADWLADLALAGIDLP